jgi:predicted dithiol-disulfide oxidoreductase (DUF899 family)
MGSQKKRKVAAQAGGGIKGHPVVSREKWLRARTALLAKEKKLTHLREALCRQRRALPWVKVEKQYSFDAPDGKQTLADLFEGRSQLVIYHFMFAPEWQQGCMHCSFWADHFDGMGVHLNHRDVTFVAISRAPLSRIARFKKRMGWKFTWVSSSNTDFNFDFNVSFTPQQTRKGTAFYNYALGGNDYSDREGLSVLYRDKSGAIFHTYSTFARGIDMLNGTYQFLDLVPKGRDEGDSPQSWVRYHDRYEK